MTFAKRSPSLWRLRTRTLETGCVTHVMGVLNVTPDSFSDGGLHLDAERAIEHGLRLLDEGAEILDIGGESTRPGSAAALSPQVEQERVLPVIAGILARRPEALLSIDTYHAATARAAAGLGAEIVNDVSGLLWDEAMAATCAEMGCGLLLMHTRGRPGVWKHLPPLAAGEVVPLVERELRERLQAAVQAGIPEEKIALDPGFGFGKLFDANYPLLAGLGELRRLGRPLVAGLSRKGFLGRTLGRTLGRLRAYHGEDAPVEARGPASLAAMTAAILAGADLVRVHDVRPAVEAAAIADAVLAAADGHFPA